MQLEVDPECLDAARFERLLGEARASAREGNAALAVSLLDRASLLWRGDAYGELAYDDFARPRPNGWRSCVCWRSKSSSRQRSS